MRWLPGNDLRDRLLAVARRPGRQARVGLAVIGLGVGVALLAVPTRRGEIDIAQPQSPPGQDQRPPGAAGGREADPRALPLAAWTRALVLGDPVAALRGSHRRKFPLLDPFPWKPTILVQSRQAVDERWAVCQARIRLNERYRRADPRAVRSTGDAIAEQLRDAVGAPAMTSDPTLYPLGPDPVSGLEEFAVIGSGSIRLRHPEPRAPEDAHLEPRPGDAIVLVLIPGTESSGLTHPLFGPLRPFLLAKGEVTVAQVNPSAAVDPVAASTVRHAFGSVNEVLEALGTLGLRSATEAEWAAAAAREATGVMPNRFGIYHDLSSTMGEWCTRSGEEKKKETDTAGLCNGTFDDARPTAAAARAAVDGIRFRPARDVPVNPSPGDEPYGSDSATAD